MIYTKVAKILSPTAVVLAAGSDQGVRDGMEFVLYELTEPIRDPDSGQPLGQLELHKGQVKVYHVQPKMSLAATVPRWTGPGLLGADALKSLFVQEELKVDRSQLGKVPDLTVRVGDTARSTEVIPAIVEANS